MYRVKKEKKRNQAEMPLEKRGFMKVNEVNDDIRGDVEIFQIME